MRNKKSMVIGVLCIALVFMGIGYAAFSSTLNLSGTATSSGTFDVRITNVVLDSTKKTAGASDTTAPITSNYAVTEQTLSATFSEPGDYLTWNITAENKGTIEAAVIVETNMLEDQNGAYKLVCDFTSGTVLAPNQTTTFSCEMSFDKNHSLTAEQFAALSKGTPVNMRVMLRAVQKANNSTPSEPAQNQIPEYIVNNDGVLLMYTGNATSVVVPDSYNGRTITSIGRKAFNNVGAIGYMFYDGSSMNVFPFRELTSEESQALTQYSINVASLDDLYNLEFDPDQGANGPASLSGSPTSQITSLDLSNAIHLQEIYEELFYCSSKDCALESVIFPTNGALTSIGNEAFFGNKISGTLTIPNSVTTIGQSAFSYNRIKILNIGSGLTTMGGAAFYNNTTTIEAINVAMTEAEWNRRNIPAVNYWYGAGEQGVEISFLSE